MKNFKELRLTDLITNEKVTAKELSLIKGGMNAELMDGCYSGICSVRINTDYCQGGAVCTHGIAG